MTRKSISLKDESGQTMAEYAFVLSVIIIGVVASLTLFSDAVASNFTDVISMFGSLG